MQKNFPSIQTLSRIDQGRVKPEAVKLARAILKARTREELEAMPIYEQYYQKIGIHMHNPHTLSELKMEMLNIALEGYGVESFKSPGHGYCDYVNFGDTYIGTIVKFQGRFFVSSWGDVAERFGAE